MTRQEFYAIVQAVRYKPEWIFDIEGSTMHHDAVKVSVRFAATDSRPPHNLMTIRASRDFILCEWDSEAFLLAGLRAWIISLEQHEVMEWFCYKGEVWQDPHARRL